MKRTFGILAATLVLSSLITFNVLLVTGHVLAVDTIVSVTIEDTQIADVQEMCNALGVNEDSRDGTYTLGQCFRKIVTDRARDLAIHQDGNRNPPPKDDDGTVVRPVCGDGTIDTDRGEQCDDGNIANGDGCDGRCQIENPR